MSWRERIWLKIFSISYFAFLNPILHLALDTHIKTILCGFGQVMLQNNALTGLMFLIGIFYNSWPMGLGAILGNIIGTISAALLRYSRDDIKNGLYGFNGTLVGIAVWFYFGINILTTSAIIAGAFLSAIVMHIIKKRISALTAPFVISTWVVIFGLKFLYPASAMALPLPQSDSLNLLSAVSMGFGQVMSQENIVTGLIFFIAILVNSRNAAIFALYGSLFGGLIALLLPIPANMVNIGLFGYNAVLCGIALGNKKFDAFLLTTFAIILSVLLYFGFYKAGIIALTAPFVLAAWTVLLVKSIQLKTKFKMLHTK